MTPAVPAAPPRLPEWIKRQREQAERANREAPVVLRRPAHLAAVRELGR